MKKQGAGHTSGGEGGEEPALILDLNFVNGGRKINKSADIIDGIT